MAKSVSKLAEVAKEGIGESAFTNMHLQMCIYNCAIGSSIVQDILSMCRRWIRSRGACQRQRQRSQSSR